MLRTLILRAVYRVIDTSWPEPATAPGTAHPAHQGLCYARWLDAQPPEDL